MVGCPSFGNKGDPRIRAEGPGAKRSMDSPCWECFLTRLVKGALCGCRECARLSASPAIIQSNSAPFDRDAKAGKIPSSYRSSENRSLEDLGDFRGH